MAPPAAAADGVMAVPMSVFPMTTALVGQHNLAGSPTSHLLMAPPAADAGVALTGGWVSLHLAPAAVTALAAATADVHTSLLLGPAADMLRNFSRVQMVEAGATAVLPGYLNLAGYVQTLLRFADLAGASAGLSSVAAAAVAGTHVQLLSAAVFVYRPVSAGAGAVAAVPGILTAKFSSTAAPAAAAAEAMVSVPKQQFLATLLGGRDLAGVTQWPAAQQHIMAPPAQSGAWPFLAGESVILSMTPAAMAATATAAACFRRAVLLGQPAAAGLTVLDWAGAVESGPSALMSGWFDLGRFVSALLEMHALGVSAAAATGRRAHLLLAAGSVTVLTGSETAATAAGAPAAAVVQGMVSAAVSTVTSSSAGALLPARSTAAARAARSAAAARAAHSAAAARAAGEPSGHSFNITYTYKAMGTESSLLPSHSGTEDDESNVWWSNPTFVPTEPFAGAGWVTRIELLEEEGSCGFKVSSEVQGGCLVLMQKHACANVSFVCRLMPALFFDHPASVVVFNTKVL